MFSKQGLTVVIALLGATSFSTIRKVSAGGRKLPKTAGSCEPVEIIVDDVTGDMTIHGNVIVNGNIGGGRNGADDAEGSGGGGNVRIVGNVEISNGTIGGGGHGGEGGAEGGGGGGGGGEVTILGNVVSRDGGVILGGAGNGGNGGDAHEGSDEESCGGGGGGGGGGGDVTIS